MKKRKAGVASVTVRSNSPSTDVAAQSVETRNALAREYECGVEIVLLRQRLSAFRDRLSLMAKELHAIVVQSESLD